MRVGAVVVAGGSGERFGGLKQFALVTNTTVAAISVVAARSVASQIVLVVPEGYTGDGEGADTVVTGGSSRSASVRHGLAHLTTSDVVVIHDAARPLATAELFRAVVQHVTAGAAAAVPALAITDTVKRITTGETPRVVETLNRDELVVVQTPQAFRADALRRAHADGGDGTDDAVLLERRGELVVTVQGEVANIKITTPSDLDFVRSELGRRS